MNFYELLQNLVENQLSQHEALDELFRVWSDNGKKRGDAQAAVAGDLLAQMNNGRSLSRALSRWVPSEEAALIAAGEKTGNLVSALEDVKRVLIAKQRISTALKTALIYPMMLCFPLCYLLYTVATELVPSMARVSDPEAWTGAGYALYVMSNLVISFGMPFVLLLLASAVVVFYSLPRWTGGLRVTFDRLPFYTLYRRVQGSTFLLNMAVMMRANVSVHDALDILDGFSNPWMRERIQGALYGLRQGKNLGVSLENAGHSFPDKESIQFVRILASRNGFAESINRYSSRWLERSIKDVERSASLARNLMIALIGVVMAVVVIGGQDIQSNFETMATKQTNSVR
jgi:type II secretory pathway component PulF